MGHSIRAAGGLTVPMIAAWCVCGCVCVCGVCVCGNCTVYSVSISVLSKAYILATVTIIH